MKKALSIVLSVLIMTSVLVVPSVSANAKKKVKAKSIKISKTLTMKKGTKKTLKVTLKPKNVTVKKVKWTSSNTKVATVSSKGKITAKKSGLTTITAKTTDGSKLKSSCTLRVLNNKPKASVKKNLNALRDYILENGDENFNGDLGIFGSDSDEKSEDKYTILYYPETKRFRFLYKYQYTDDPDTYHIDTFVEMEYALTGYDYCTLYVDNTCYEYDEITSYYSADVIIPTAAYNSESVAPTIKVKSKYGFSNSDVKESAGLIFQLALFKWGLLLINNLSISLQDIGFTDF